MKTLHITVFTIKGKVKSNTKYVALKPQVAIS